MMVFLRRGMRRSGCMALVVRQEFRSLWFPRSDLIRRVNRLSMFTGFRLDFEHQAKKLKQLEFVLYFVSVKLSARLTPGVNIIGFGGFKPD
jgi:hypothetical protein